MLLVHLPRQVSRALLSCTRRNYASTLPPLPPAESWQQEFQTRTLSRRDRLFLKNPNTARSLVEAFLKPTADGNKGKVVIEAFPGPGVLSRALLELPSSSLRKLIILEDDEGYLKYLNPLQEVDPRVTVVPISGHSWDSYSEIEALGLLHDVEPAPWETTVSDLHFITHLTQNVKGEQLIAQLFRSIPERSWLFKYGRVPMHILMSDWVWTRLSAGPGPGAHALRRCKLGVIGEATATSKNAIPSHVLQPYEDHFFPPANFSSKGVTNRKVGQPMHAITSIPHAEQVILKGQIDDWDYCLRKLFVLKTHSFQVAINSLAPGARTLVAQLTDPTIPRNQRVNVAKRVRDLDIADWALVLRTFINWPFKPTDILISDSFNMDSDA